MDETDADRDAKSTSGAWHERLLGRRSHVVQVVLLYLAGVWLLLQIVDVVGDVLALPDWTLRLVGALGAIGLPAVTIVAWVYAPADADEADATGAPSAPAPARAGLVARRLTLATLGTTLLAAALFLLLPTSREDEDAGGEAVAAPEDSGGADTFPAPGVTLAVLPFANLSADADYAFFADGIAEEVLTRISRSADLDVISRSSSFSYRDRALTVPQIAQDLGATHVLEGSVRRSGNRIRVSAQLIVADGDRLLWSETFDRELREVFAVQDDIARSIASSLDVRLGAGDTPRREIDAFDTILQARYLTARRQEPEALQRAIALLRRAVEEVPDDGELWAQLALAQMLLANWSDGSQETLQRVRDYAETSLELEPDNVTALVARGAWALSTFSFAVSERDLRRALELNPNSADAANWYGDLLTITLRFEEALRYEGLARRLDPLVAVHAHNYAWAAFFLGRYEESLAALDRALELDPAFLSAARLQVGFRDRATGERAAADAWLAQTDLDVVEENRSAIDARREFVLAGNLSGMAQYMETWQTGAYPIFMWPGFPTEAWALAMNEEYAAFWRREPQRRLLEVRGDRQFTIWKSLRERAVAEGVLPPAAD